MASVEGSDLIRLFSRPILSQMRLLFVTLNPAGRISEPSGAARFSLLGRITPILSRVSAA